MEKLNQIVDLVSQRLVDDPDLSEFCSNHANEMVGEYSDEDDDGQWFAVYNQAFLNVLVRVGSGHFQPGEFDPTT